MSGRQGRLLAVVLVGLAQLAVPAWMIASRERTLAEGKQWRFRTAPVDPPDAFRGNYLALDYSAAEAVVPRGLAVEAGDRVVVPIQADREGFATFGPLRRKPPAGGDWLRVRVGWLREKPPGERRASLELPFDRFYLDERDAPRAEAAFARLRGAEYRAWALVRVRDGKAVLEDVVIEGRSVRGGASPR